MLDVVFVEVFSRVRTGRADRNLAFICYRALNLLKHEHTAKVGIKTKPKRPAGISIKRSRSCPCDVRLPCFATGRN